MTQRYRITSDWHVQHWNYKDIDKEFLTKTEDDKNQILLFAGDICNNFSQFDKSIYVFKFLPLLNRFKDVVYVSGNHDFYFSDISARLKKHKHVCKQLGINYLENSTYKNISGCTLWTEFDCDSETRLYSELGMNDYRTIKGFSIETGIDLFKKSKQFLENSNSEIIMTHHLPSFRSVADKYQGSPLNYAFASNLEELILKTKPKLWIHGHTHHNFDYMIGETRVICNPVGYPGENLEYNPNLVVEI